MSRFFRGGSDSDSSDSSSEDEKPKRPTNAFAALGGDSDSDSDSSSSSSSEDDTSDGFSHSDYSYQSEEDKPAQKATGYNRFLAGASDSDESDSDEDEDERKVVKSSKEKRFDELRSGVSAMAAARRGRDFIAIQQEFDKITKLYQKSQAIIRQAGGAPRFYVRFLVNLEDFIKKEQANKAQFKKLDALSSRAFNAVKQTLRKYAQPFEDKMTEFRANPITAAESADEAEDLEEEEAKDEESKAAGDDEEDDGFQTVGKSGKVFKAKTETLFKQVREIIEARGKKSTEKTTQIVHLEALLEVAATPYQKIKVLSALIPAQLDTTTVSQATSGTYVPSNYWRSAAKNVIALIKIIEETPKIVLVEKDITLPEDEVIDGELKEGKNIVELRIPVLSYVDRLDDEFTRSLQNIDPHTLEYVTRLKEETYLYALLVKTQSFFETILEYKVKEAEKAPPATPVNSVEKKKIAGIKSSLSTESLNELGEFQGKDDVETYSVFTQLIKMRRVEHLYYKPDNVIKAVDEQVRKQYPDLIKNLEDPDQIVETLCVSLYPCKIDRIRARALLCHVYHMALHDDYRRAHDIVLMSHTSDNIDKTDISTQILFNRTMVQIGFCAFRNGLIREALYALQDIYSNESMKELLAQGVQSSKFSGKTIEQERLARMRQLPFHMHINLELLECIYLTCAMLLEIPSMARYQHDLRRRIISKPFTKFYTSSTRKVFTGPPENTRERIIVAADFVAKGDWKKAVELFDAIKILDLFPKSEEVKTMLISKIKQETLRTYLFSFAVPYYDSISLSLLSEMFDLDQQTVNTIVSRMIIREEIQAKLSTKTDTLVLYSTGQSRGHALAEGLVEKITRLVESNDRIQEALAQAVTQPDAAGENSNQSKHGHGHGHGHHKSDRNGRSHGPGGKKSYNNNNNNKRKTGGNPNAGAAPVTSQ